MVSLMVSPGIKVIEFWISKDLPCCYMYTDSALRIAIYKGGGYLAMAILLS